MSDFGDQVDFAARSIWRLMLWDVPENLGGLASRLGFRQTKKNPRHWWRTFDPATDKDLAVSMRDELLAAGIKGSWGKITSKPRGPRPPPSTPSRNGKNFKRHAPRSSREGFGGALNARPIAGSWRRKTRNR